MENATLRIGETLVLDAPANAVSFRIFGEGAAETAEVRGGKAVVPAETTARWRPGQYRSGWRVVEGNVVSLPDGPDFQVADSAFSSRGRSVAATFNERVLAAARKALETAAEGTAVSVSTDGFSSSFETRAELLAFVAMMETRVARERGAPRVRSVGVRC